MSSIKFASEWQQCDNRTMRYRRFGKTGLAMPVLSCGGMRFQWKWQDVPPSEIPAENQGNVEAIIRRALELGINHIETARGYGSSEMQLGSILPRLSREKILVQTKVTPRAKPAEFLETVQESMRHMKLECDILRNELRIDVGVLYIFDIYDNFSARDRMQFFFQLLYL